MRNLRYESVTLCVLLAIIAMPGAQAVGDLVLTLSGPSVYQANQAVFFGGQLRYGTVAGVPLQSVDVLVDGNVVKTSVTGYDGYYSFHLYFQSGQHEVQTVYAKQTPAETRSPIIRVSPSAPSFTIANGAVNEGNSGTTVAVFSVTMSAPLSVTATVDYATRNGTADGSDYQSTSGTLAFSAGQTVKQISVSVFGDTVDEPDESFYVDLSNPVSATIQRATATGTIRNDEPIEVYFGLDDDAVTEGGSFTVGVWLSRSTNSSISVSYQTADRVLSPPSQRASAGSDYLPTTGTLTFPAGSRYASFTVNTLEDSVCEGTEVFALQLSNAVGATIRFPEAIRGIYDDDGPC